MLEIRPGTKVKVTWISHGEAVYDRSGSVVNANWKPVETTCIGVVNHVERECGFGAIVVKCYGVKGCFQFYPKDTGPKQIVEITS